MGRPGAWQCSPQCSLTAPALRGCIPATERTQPLRQGRRRRGAVVGAEVPAAPRSRIAVAGQAGGRGRDGRGVCDPASHGARAGIRYFYAHHRDVEAPDPRICRKQQPH